MQARHRAISDVRGLGCYFGVEVGIDGLADRVLYASLERGLSFKLGGGNVVTLCPPLTISDAAFGACEGPG